MPKKWKSLSDKTVVITGAASGIGLAMTEQLLAAGARVAASDVHEQRLQELSTLASEDHLLVTRVDVANRDQVLAWAKEIEAKYGAVDAVINNAGVALVALAATQPRAEFEWLFNINFWGVVNGCEAFMPLLERAENARLVNISSVFGMMALPTQSAYNASKFAVRGYSEALRHELEEGSSTIALTTVHPGGVKTNIARDGRHLVSLDGGAADREKAAQQFDAAASTSAEKAASQIIEAMMRGQRRLLIGADARIIDWLVRLMPVRYNNVLGPLKRWLVS